jgi:hypothetical protein
MATHTSEAGSYADSAGDTFSPAEIRVEIDRFTDLDWLRVKKAALYFSGRCGLEWRELQNEALVRSLDGRRKCPKRVRVTTFLGNIIRSIASERDELEGHLALSPELEVQQAAPAGLTRLVEPADPVASTIDVISLFEGVFGALRRRPHCRVALGGRNRRKRGAGTLRISRTCSDGVQFQTAVCEATHKSVFRKEVPMTDRANKFREKIARIDDLVLDDLAAMTDEQLLSEAIEEGIGIAAVGIEGRDAYEHAQILIGRERLATIRREMAETKERSPLIYDRAKSQSRFRSILAVNRVAAAKLTMAARNQTTSKRDEDMEGILEDFIELGALPDDKEDGDEDC